MNRKLDVTGVCHFISVKVSMDRMKPVYLAGIVKQTYEDHDTYLGPRSSTSIWLSLLLLSIFTW